MCPDGVENTVDFQKLTKVEIREEIARERTNGLKQGMAQMIFHTLMNNWTKF
jgi:hypothetical protein